MATTTITGTINGVNNAALANKWITFRLVQLGTDSAATATVAQSVDSVQTDANGDFSIDVWNNGDSGKPSVLEITVDGSKAENVIIPTGTASIELWDLIENYQADGSTSEQVPVVSALFLRKSNNLSELTPTSSTARTNLGVAIGTDVQAHSAILDATTASFTVAEESKLSGIEALAEVNDPATVLDADIGLTVQAHSAILDATTASFTTAKDTAISTNTTNIATNVTNIATNVTNIDSNAAAIALNTAKVTNATHTGDVTGDTALTIAAAAVDLAMLSASGTKDATTFLRGDNTFAVPAGDMAAATYDPTAVGGDAFAMDNMVEGITTKILTDTERTAISANTSKVTNATHTGDVTGDTALTISTDAVDIPMLSASGTPDATTFLRGDNTWSTPTSSDYSPIAIITESTTARSLSLTDIGGYIRLTNVSSCTITVPDNATVDWAGETEPPTIYVRVTAGVPTLSNAGVTINDTLGVIAALETGSTFALQWVASNVWDII